jgi:hypothetical protein
LHSHLPQQVLNMSKVTVYRFEVMDRKAAKLIPDARMAIADTIRRLRAEADLGSALEVDRAELDDEGFYVGEGARPA